MLTKGVICTAQNKARKKGWMTQCWEEGVLDDSIQVRIINKMDNRVVQLDSAIGVIKMMNKDDSNVWQKWMLRVNGFSGQFVSVGSNNTCSQKHF